MLLVVLEDALVDLKLLGSSRDKWEDKTLTSPFLEAELEDGNIRKGEDETANGPISRNSHRTSVGHPTYSGMTLKP